MKGLFFVFFFLASCSSPGKKDNKREFYRVKSEDLLKISEAYRDVAKVYQTKGNLDSQGMYTYMADSLLMESQKYSDSLYALIDAKGNSEK